MIPYRQPVEFGLTRYGPMLYLPSDLYLGRSLKFYGEYSPSECKFYEKIVRPDWVCYDIGANIGVLSLVMGRLAREVHAFEPQPLLYKLLKANVAMNDLEPGETRNHQIWARQMALGKEEKVIKVPIFDYQQENNYGSVSYHEWGDGEEVPQMTLDGVVTTPPNLLKIDVEGMEMEVLRGGEETIRRSKPIIVIENDRAEGGRALIEYMYSLDYTPYWFNTLLFETKNFFSNVENIFGMQASFNMICLPPDCELKLEGFRKVQPEDPIGICDSKHIIFL